MHVQYTFLCGGLLYKVTVYSLIIWFGMRTKFNPCYNVQATVDIGLSVAYVIEGKVMYFIYEFLFTRN